MSRFFLLVILTFCVSCAMRDGQPKDAAAPSVDAAFEANVEQGEGLYNTCKTCHGATGEGNEQLGAPAMANTDTWYLYRQLKNFNQGIRGYHSSDSSGIQMAAFAKSLGDTAKMWNVVKYIETFPDILLKTEPIGDIRKGERIYESICGSCHGPGAKGNELMHAPRLNGLQPWYLLSQITKFKTGLRGTHPQDKYGAPMVPMMELLKDDQSIKDVIAYIQSTTHEMSQ